MQFSPANKYSIFFGGVNIQIQRPPLAPVLDPEWSTRNCAWYEWKQRSDIMYYVVWVVWPLVRYHNTTLKVISFLRPPPPIVSPLWYKIVLYQLQRLRPGFPNYEDFGEFEYYNLRTFKFTKPEVWTKFEHFYKIIQKQKHGKRRTDNTKNINDK